MFNVQLGTSLTLISWVTLCDVPNTVRFLTARLHGTCSLWWRMTNDQVNECYHICLNKGRDWGGKRKSCFGELRSLAPAWIMSEVMMIHTCQQSVTRRQEAPQIGVPSLNLSEVLKTG